MTKLTYWIEREWEGLLGWFFDTFTPNKEGDPGVAGGIAFTGGAILLAALALDTLCMTGAWGFWEWVRLITGGAAVAFIAFMMFTNALAHANA